MLKLQLDIYQVHKRGNKQNDGEFSTLGKKKLPSEVSAFGSVLLVDRVQV